MPRPIKTKPIKISDKELAAAFTACGQSVGYFTAEMILMKYLPTNKPDGKCYQVAQSKRPAMMAELKLNTKDK